jgi:hypothetical protein
MSTWIKHPLHLEGEKIRLSPLEENHFEALVDISKEAVMWQFMPIDGTDRENLLAALTDALLLREKCEQYPFVVIDKTTNRGNRQYKIFK